MKQLIISIILAAFVSSCMVGPRYVRPATDTLAVWNNQNQFINPNDTITNLKWFEIFQDSVLNGLISDALANNNNLKNAVLRIEQARASYGNSKADLLPSIGYSAMGSLSDPETDVFNIFGTASWELDFWGKLRRSKRASYANLLASEEGMKTVTTTLISDVATLYFSLRDLDNRLVIAKQTVESRTEYVRLIEQRFKGGYVSELDLLQANQQLAIAKATFSSITRQLNSTERSLNVLLGQIPKSIPRGVANKDQANIPVIPAGLPSSILEQRPDVRQAEFLLQAETERVGVAQASRLPNISLTGFLGLASPELSTLIGDESFASNATATILGPIFSFGKNQRRVDIQRKEAEIAANNYVNVYLSALGEVENSLVSIQTYQDEYMARNAQAEAALKALTLSRERYNNGYTEYLEVLIAENSMFDSELLASQAKAQQLSAYIQLYRTLGGGW